MLINLPLLKLFPFEVVTVAQQGKILQRQTKTAEYFSEDLGNGVTLELVAIPSGKLMMGASLAEKDSDERQRPQHEVKLQPFLMGKFPVTQAQWKAVANLPLVERKLKSNPSSFQGDNRPVEKVSWYDAVEFCHRLSLETGHEYRLPSEAEWEYAIRAGTTTPFHFGETMKSDLANYGGIRNGTTPVGSFPPNAFGLYDLHGNVWEWCADNWHDDYQGAPTDGSAWLEDDKQLTKVIRGGAWDDPAEDCRCGFRFNDLPDDNFYNLGFRVVCGLTKTG